MRKNFVLLVLLLGMVASVAKADTFNLVSAGSLTVGPVYGTVTITQSGANVNVAVTLASGDEFISTGAGGNASFLFDLNVSPITVPSGSLTSGYTLVSNVSANNSIHADGTGSWDYAITCSGCGSGGSSPIGGTLNFTVDGVSLSNFVNNLSGNLFAADICVGSPGCSGGTGDVINSVPVSSAPEPSSLALLGTPALSFGFMAIRRRLLPHWKQ